MSAKPTDKPWRVVNILFPPGGKAVAEDLGVIYGYPAPDHFVLKGEYMYIRQWPPSVGGVVWVQIGISKEK